MCGVNLMQETSAFMQILQMFSPASLVWPHYCSPSAGIVGYSQLTGAPFSRDLPLAVVATSPRRSHTTLHQGVAINSDQKIEVTTDWLPRFKEGHLCATIYASDSPLTLAGDQAKARHYQRPHLC